MSGKQNKNGNAFEFALANCLACAVGVEVKPRELKALSADKTADKARDDFFEQPPEFRRWLAKAAEAAISHIVKLEGKALAKAGEKNVQMLPDSAGQEGDPRDIILPVNGRTIAVSAKLNNDTMKNPRLQFGSPNFADAWGLGANVSSAYRGAVSDVAKRVERARKSGAVNWRDISELHGDIYVPLLLAFRDEMLRLMGDESKSASVCRAFARYMVGERDYYKVMAYDGEDLVVVQGYNFNRKMPCPRPPFPKFLISAALLRTTTLVLTFDGGWVFTMRIHTAETRVTNSLKWDVRIIGHPSELYSHHIML